MQDYSKCSSHCGVGEYPPSCSRAIGGHRGPKGSVCYLPSEASNDYLLLLGSTIAAGLSWLAAFTLKLRIGPPPA